MSNICVGAIQMTSGNDMDANIKSASDLIAQGAALGANYIQTPEMTSFLDQGRDAYMSIAKLETDDKALQAFQALAHAHAIFLHIGSMAILLPNGKIANRSFIINPEGKIIARYDKLHMFDVDLGNGEAYHESRTYEPGSEAVLVSLPFAKLGLSICYDVRFPYLYRALAQAGAQILAVPAAFTKKTGEVHWHTLLKARAIETGSFVIASAQCGTHPKERQTFGHSLIISPWGEVIAEAGKEPAVITAHINISAVQSTRSTIPAIHLQKKFELTQV